jgi:hypothetical protein
VGESRKSEKRRVVRRTDLSLVSLPCGRRHIFGRWKKVVVAGKGKKTD